MTSPNALALLAQASDARETLATLEGIPCDSEANAALLGGVFVAAYAEANRLEAELKERIAPKKAEIKADTALYMPTIDAYRAVEAHVREKTEQAALDGLARKEQAQDAAILAARTGESLALALAAEPPVLPGTLTVSFDWSFELTGEPVDPAFLEPSPKKITEFLKQYKNSSHVPERAGVRWKRIAATRAKAVGK